MDFNVYNAKKQQVSNTINEVKSVYAELGSDYASAETDIIEVYRKLQNDTFKVVVMGQFKVGKSTFINALLGGGDILPAAAPPCTAIINEVKYATDKKAIIHFKNPVPPLPPTIMCSIKDYVNKFGGKNVNPISIPVESIEDYVVIDINAESQSKAIVESPYEKAELFWPLEICKQGVEIIDTPGLNENESRTKVTKDYLTNADAIVFVLSCIAPCAQNEMTAINNDIISSGHQYIFFVGNRINQIALNQQEKQKTHIISKLKDKTKFGEKGIFFVNAEDAKDGRHEHNQVKLAQSGILEFEKLLNDFLINQRGVIKLSQPIIKTIYSIDKAINETIPNEQRMLNTSLVDLDHRLQLELPNLDRLKRERAQLKEQITNRIERIGAEVGQKIEFHLNEMERSMRERVYGVPCDSSISIFSPEDSTKEFTEELIKKLQDKILEEQNTWQHDSIEPFINGRLEEMREDFKYKFRNILLEIDAMNLRISGSQEVNSPGAVERITAMVAGFLGGGIGGAAAGGAMGFSTEFIGTIVAQIVAAIGLMLLGATSPVILVGMILIAIVGMGTMGSNAEDRTRDEVIKEVLKAMQNEKRSITINAVKTLKQKLLNSTKELDKKIDEELNAVEEKIESIRAKKREGQVQVDRRQQLLITSLTNLKLSRDKLDLILESFK
ncbi:MAG: dynamin family protein [Prevotella sp.]|nr:dynamin family protein [Prevotella sp.]